MSTPTETAPPKLSRVDLLPLLRPDQEWLCAEGGELVIILSIDVGTMYPVLYEWSTSKHEGRDSADGFIRDFRPADPLGFLASLQAALATLQAENAELRERLEAAERREATSRMDAGAADEQCEEWHRVATAAEGDRDRLRELLGRWMFWASGVAFKSEYGEQVIADTDRALAVIPHSEGEARPHDPRCDNCECPRHTEGEASAPPADEVKRG